MVAADREATPRSSAFGRGAWSIWVYIWLIALFYPARDIARGHARPAPLAAVILLAFAVVYVVCLQLSFRAHRRGERDAVSPQRLTLLAGLIGIAALAVVLFGGPWTSLVTFVAAAAAMVVPLRWGAYAVVATTCLNIGLAFAHGSSFEDALGEALGPFTAGAVTLGFRRQRVLIARLEEAQGEIAALAVADERLRFARDLHDLLGHTLSLIVLKGELVRRTAERDPTAAAAAARDIEDVGRRALAEVREAVTGYRERDFATELGSARSALADVGVDLTVRRAALTLPVHVDAVLAWAVREGATNVLRHSGAGRCTIELRENGGDAVLEIADNGVGPPAAVTGDGHGLAGLAERAALAGGSVEAGSRPGDGFRLLVRVPLVSDFNDFSE